MNILRFNLYVHLFILLFFLTSCILKIEDSGIEIDTPPFDGPPSVLLIIEDNEIGQPRLDEFKELHIDIVYLDTADLSILDRYEIIYLGARTIDMIDDEILRQWRDSEKLIVGIDTQPTKLVSRLSVPEYKASPVDLDLNFLPENKFIASGYAQSERGYGILQDFFSSVLHLHRTMSVKQSNVHNQ